jgi:hypothetical protein
MWAEAVHLATQVAAVWWGYVRIAGWDSIHASSASGGGFGEACEGVAFIGFGSWDEVC